MKIHDIQTIEEKIGLGEITSWYQLELYCQLLGIESDWGIADIFCSSKIIRLAYDTIMDSDALDEHIEKTDVFDFFFAFKKFGYETNRTVLELAGRFDLRRPVVFLRYFKNISYEEASKPMTDTRFEMLIQIFHLVLKRLETRKTGNPKLENLYCSLKEKYSDVISLRTFGV